MSRKSNLVWRVDVADENYENYQKFLLVGTTASSVERMALRLGKLDVKPSEKRSKPYIRSITLAGELRN